MKLIVFWAGFLLWGVAAPAVADSFTMKWENFPSETGDCSATADRVAAAFEKAYGTEIDLAVASKKEGRCKIALTYTAEQAKALVTTDQPIPFGEEGWRYSSIKQCEADLAGQRKVFVDQTGLEPFTAHCYSNHLNGGPVSHTLRIEAFGAAQRIPFVVRAPRSYAVQKKLNTQIITYLQAKGAVVFREAAAVSPAAASGNDWIHYYATVDFEPIQAFGPWLDRISFVSVKQCESEVPFIDKILTTLGGTAVAKTCADSKSPMSKTAFHLLYTGVQGMQWEKPENNEYGSVEQCQKNRDRVVTYYQQKLGKNIAGAICFMPQFSDNVLMYFVSKKAN